MTDLMTREVPITKEQMAELLRLGLASERAQAEHRLAIRIVMAGHGMPDVVPVGVGGTLEAPTLVVPDAPE